MISTIQNIDWTVLHGIQSVLKCAVLDFILPKITMLGDGGTIWIISAFAMIFTKKYRRFGIVLLAGLAFGLLTGTVIKDIVARPRPYTMDANIHPAIAFPRGTSFPSGHTLSSTIAATIITKTNKKFAFAAIPLAALIAFSRLYLRVHFLSDVVIAICLGVIIGLASFAVGNIIYRKHSERKAKRATAEEK